MKTSAILSSLIVALAASCTPQETLPHMQRIHTEGNCFVNESGEIVVFQGLCLSDPVKLIRDGQWGEPLFAEAESWGANVVRFAVHPSNIRQMGWDETFRAMDEGIEWAKKHNLYVVMDWHSIGNLKDAKYTNPMYDTTLDETFRFWRTAAQRYKDEPAVALYELFNEPTCSAPNDELGHVTWGEWKGILEQVIDTVRAYNPDAVCMCAGFNWAYDLTDVATDPVGRENIAYVSHPYPMKRPAPWVEKWERDFGYVADTYPLFCTELGFCLKEEKGSHIPVIGDDIYGATIMRYFEQKGISYTVWCFDPDWGPMLISDWDYTPTTQGRYFKHYLQSLGKATNSDFVIQKKGDKGNAFSYAWNEAHAWNEATISDGVLSLGTHDGYYDLMPESGRLISTLSDYTISVRYNVGSGNDLSGYGHFLFAFSSLAANKADEGPYVAMRLNEQRFEVSTGGWDHEQIIMQGGKPEPDTWVHAVYRQKGTCGELYLDGRLIGRNDNMPLLYEIFADAPAWCWIGRAPFKGDRYLSDTQVRDFTIFDYAISDEELQSLAE